MKTVAILQPGYLPWLGFFEQMHRADDFVYYDDVQFDKHGWRNRNRLRGPHGPQWITVPVLHKGHGPQMIRDVRTCDGPWPRKHLASIRQLYGATPGFQRIYPALERILSGRWPLLMDLNIAVAEALSLGLGISPPRIHFSSELGIAGERTERLVAICKRLNASHYLTGNAASSYLDTALFKGAGIEVVWQDYKHPQYTQQFDGFIPYLSALDYIMNTGDCRPEDARRAFL